MPPRKTRGPVRATQSTRSRAKVEQQSDGESPDPIGSTPVPSETGSGTRSRRLRSAIDSSPAPSSTQAPSSEARQGRKEPKSRLRSGRRSKGYTGVVLGEEDLVVPSDEEEYEVWVEGKVGESSKMAQERYERESSVGQRRGLRNSGSSRQTERVFVPLFSPTKAPAGSPPLESQSASTSGYTSSTVPISRQHSADDPFSTVEDDGLDLGHGLDLDERHSARVSQSPSPVKSLKPVLEPLIPDDRTSQAAEHNSDEVPRHASQSSMPRPTLSAVPPGPAMEDLEGLDDVEMGILDEVGEGPRTPTTSPAPPEDGERDTVKVERLSLPTLGIAPVRQPAARELTAEHGKQEPESYLTPSDSNPLPSDRHASPDVSQKSNHQTEQPIGSVIPLVSQGVPHQPSQEAGLPPAPKPEPESIKPNLTPPPSTPIRNSYQRPVGQIPDTGSTNAPFFTPSPSARRAPTQPTQDSPLVESQLGLDGGMFGSAVSPTRSEEHPGHVDGPSLPPSSMPMPASAEGSPRTPRKNSKAPSGIPVSAASVPPQHEGMEVDDALMITPRRSAEPARSSPDAIAGFRSPSPLSPLPAHMQTLAPLPMAPAAESVPPIDPALERFRGARSFRTRTTLQLQPYTRERLLYEAALRKGGLKKSKRPFEIPRSQPSGDDAYVQDEPRSTADRIETDPEAIVIEPSPPPRPPTPVEITEADCVEYRFQYGNHVDIGTMATQVRGELEGIARQRVDAEKKAKQAARKADRQRRKFERLVREQERGDPDDETYRPMPIPAATAGGAKRKPTQGPKQRLPSNTAVVTSTKRSAPKPTRPNPAVEPTSESEASAGIRLSTASRRSPSAQPSLPDLGGYGGFDSLPPPPPNSAPRVISSDSESGSNPDSDSDSSTEGHKDKRAKIARRMLPAAMLRRLEEEAARKERDKVAARRRNDRVRSPSAPRPGRAVVRHGNGDGVEFNDFLDEVAQGPASSSISPDPTPEQGFESDVSGRERPIDVRSSSSEGSDSQAEEDHGFGGGGGGGESLAQLYRGDFQSLVAGVGRLPPKKHTSRLDRDRVRENGRSKGKKQNHRPALALKKQVRAPTSLSRNNHAMVQSRLVFPIDDRPTPNAKARGTKRSHQPTSARKDQHRDRARPAIRLDDRTIFATDDFAFDDDDDDVVLLDAPRPTKRAAGPRTSGPVAEVETLDTGVGKARSWAYLDKLSVDFGITPLPSGLYCSPDSVPGSGHLAHLADLVQGKADRGSIVIEPCVAYGVELYPSLTIPAIQAVVPIIFDKIYESATARILSSDAEAVNLSPLRFLGPYLVIADGELDDLISHVRKGMYEITAKLDLLDLPLGKSGRDARNVVLELRWAVFELAIYLTSKSDSETSVNDMAVPLFSHLLSAGFDKAIKPLKSILRGESDTAEISDPALTIWISALHILSQTREGDIGLTCLAKALDSHYPHDQVGPLAAERIWYLVFGLCAVNQFDINGRTSASYSPVPQWTLVRRAIGLIKISHNEEAEEGAHLHQLQGRDRYIKVMLARCIRLSSVWQWPFDRESFSIATKDLGTIFKDRQYRNLPTESPVDFPTFITQFNMTLTAAVDSKRESAFELYLRLVCVAASDLISASQSLTEAQRAEKDVQRLVMTIMPVSPVKFNRILPPTPRQLGQLINRYSTMVAATYFSPSLLPWLLSCSKKWVVFENADFDSRQVSIRGLMYVAVACRHHGQSSTLALVVNRLAEILGLLQKELDRLGKGSIPVHAPSRLEVERTMVMVVSCVKQVILHHTFDPEQSDVTYPDPSLLHESWTTCVFALDLSKDLKCSTEVVATIQAFLDTRLKALPDKAKRGPDDKVESQDEFGSLGFELDDTTLAQLGGGDQASDPIQKQDERFATVLENVICPRIYRLLSDMLPAVAEGPAMSEDKVEFVAKLTKCFSDCAGILVIDHRRLDWSTFIGPFGKMSWSRLGDDKGRLEVGLHFMLNVAKKDPPAFSRHEDEFVALLLQCLVTAKWGVEQKYVQAVMSIPQATDHPLLTAINSAHYIDGDRFMEHRTSIIEVILLNIADQLKSRLEWATSKKPFIYRCLNLLVSSMASNDKSIHEARVLHKQEYRAFSTEIVNKMRRILGDGVVIPSVLPSLKYFL